jgi:hypothetical protein
VLTRVGLPDAHPIAGSVRDFLADLTAAGRSPHTVRGYRGDLAEFAEHHGTGPNEITAAFLR